MKGIIGFNQHKIHCIIGLNSHERVKEQEITVDLQIEVDFAQCAKTDLIQDTIDYEMLAKLCTDIAHRGRFNLLEAYAYTILIELKERGISWACIKVSKAGALPSAKNAFVELSYGTRGYKWVGH